MEMPNPSQDWTREERNEVAVHLLAWLNDYLKDHEIVPRRLAQVIAARIENLMSKPADFLEGCRSLILETLETTEQHCT